MQRNKMSNLLIGILILLLVAVYFMPGKISHADTNLHWWEVQSVDTMKYSRDPSREALNNPEFAITIDKQVRDIASTNATHIAIGTPYDDDFAPVMKLWVGAARKYGLKVWFRGNFSGWEGWFDKPKITRDQHSAMLQKFIINNPSLFADGDIFSPCPECENGGPGDPRQTGDVEGHRLFLIKEHQIADEAFAKIGRKVSTSFNSMNGDVAKAIMDKRTTTALGGIVVIDHYVPTPEKLVSDVNEIARMSGGKIFLGEIGVPIPDIHGSMTEKEQADWLDSVLGKLALDSNVIGINYWTSFGGSTEIWNSQNNSPRQAVAVLTKYFRPKIVTGRLANDFGGIISGANLTTSQGRTGQSDSEGYFALPYMNDSVSITVNSKDYLERTISYNSSDSNPEKIVLGAVKEDWLSRLLRFVSHLFGR